MPQGPPIVPNDGEVGLSVVVPVYGCRGSLRALHARIRTSVGSVTPSFEIIFIDDGSPDGAWETILDIARGDHLVRGFRLSRNFGQHAAITAGLAQTRGRWVVVMDCDLQEDPEDIPRLHRRALEGYDVVFTTRRRELGLRALVGRTYMRLLNFFLQTDVGVEHGTLSILARKVVDAFLTLRDRDREYVLAVAWLGFRQTSIEVERRQRYEGTSSYTLARLIQTGIDGLFFQTSVLLSWIVLAGFGVAVAGLGLAVYDLIVYLTSKTLPGYTSLAVLILLLSGTVLTSMGVVGLYVGRIFDQVKERPLFIIDAQVGNRSVERGESRGDGAGSGTKGDLGLR